MSSTPNPSSSPSQHRIECIAIVGKQNQPIYIKNLTNQSDVELSYHIHSCLDAVEAQLSDSNIPHSELYLGLVNFMEDLNTYAYCTASRIKFLMVIRWCGVQPSEASVKEIFVKIHKSYCSLMENPFYPADGIISGKVCHRFDSIIEKCSL